MKKRYLALLLALLTVFSLAISAMPAAAAQQDAAGPMETTPPESDDPAESPDVSEDPDPSESPDVSENPDPSESPDVSDAPQPSESPKVNGPWYQDAMDYAVREGLIKGDDKGNLNPEKNATRAEVVTILMRIFRNTQKKELWQYLDVPASEWYYKDMCTAADMNILTGYPDRTMRPNASITRQEAFALIARAFGLATGSASSLDRFSDRAAIGDWAVPAIAGMVEAGYLQGDYGRMRPGDKITRAEIAQVLYNLKLSIIDDPSELPEDGIVVYQGRQPIDIEGFKGKLILGGQCGSAVTVTGDAPEASLCVRTNPNSTVTLNGTVKDTCILSRGTRLVGSGNAGAVNCAETGCSVSCPNSGVKKTYDAGIVGAKLYATGVAALTPENRTVTFTVNIDGSGCDYTNKESGRTAILQWTKNGVTAGTQEVWLGYTPSTVQFTVSEPVWWAWLSGSHDYHFILMYGTDALALNVSIPIQNYTAAEYQQLQSRSYPYKIEVVRNQCTVLIYGQDKAGNYNILYRVAVCSPGYATPLGTFRTPQKMRWHPLMGGVWGQYCTQIYQGFLFHSVYYHTSDPSTLYASAYNQLGTICSHGCVRLTVADAKWIYDNCRLGTVVHIYDSSWLPVAKPTAQKIPYSGVLSGWDPTDPDPRNPWH